jgi:hypothetical protein
VATRPDRAPSRRASPPRSDARLAAASLALVALLAAGAHADAAPATASFDYLYIRAHENNASGGHAAIRFGADTFDFQHRDGWIVLRREDSGHFQNVYRALENRSIELSRIETTPDRMLPGGRLRAEADRAVA